MALLEDDWTGPERGARARRALITGAVGAALGILLTGLLPNISASVAVAITLVGAAIGAWAGAWVERRRVAARPRSAGAARAGKPGPIAAGTREPRSYRARRAAHP